MFMTAVVAPVFPVLQVSGACVVVLFFFVFLDHEYAFTFDDLLLITCHRANDS